MRSRTANRARSRRPARSRKPFFSVDGKGTEGEKPFFSDISDSHTIQRTIGDGHDLSSPRFKGNGALEAAYDNERTIKDYTEGGFVTKIQQALIDDGGSLPAFGVDGKYGSETAAAVLAYQNRHGLAEKDGKVGPETMGDMDNRFPAVAPPGPAPAPAPAPGPGPGPGPQPPAAGVQVMFLNRVRAFSTPASMAQDRIPPRKDHPVMVLISGFSAPMAPIHLSVQGAGGGNGTVTINGTNTHSVVGTSLVKLKGVTQTSPGNGGNLQLVATQGGAVLAQSNNFSVSAIPENWTATFVNRVRGTRRGFVVQDGWDSDSGVVGDLNQADISEQVEYTGGTGIWTGVNSGNNSGYLAGDSFTTDTHSSARATLTGPGYLLAKQTSIFRDNRSGANDIPMKNSGYKIHRRVNRIPFLRRLWFRLHKLGARTTANGFASDAGVGDVDKGQFV